MTLFKQTYVSDDDDVTLIIQKWNIFSKVDEEKNHMFTGKKIISVIYNLVLLEQETVFVTAKAAVSRMCDRIEENFKWFHENPLA